MKLFLAYCLLFVVSTCCFAQDKNIADSCFVRLPPALSVNADDPVVRIINNCFFDSISIRVYDRWGQLVFQSNMVSPDHSIGWEWWKNKDLKSDVYVWMIKVRFINVDFIRKSFTGHITIIK